MALSEALLPEFDRETANTRKMLARIPEKRLEWTPHEKSMSFVGLATHLANLPSWAVIAIEQDHFDVAPPDADSPRQSPIASVAEALAMFDKNVADARAAIENTGDERFLTPWSLLAGGNTVFTMPRIAVIRNMVMNHLIHHRAQLGVYLRLNDVPVPAVYGPTADEQE
jgi:uncharacterized damage-inducible protein DinB